MYLPLAAGNLHRSGSCKPAGGTPGFLELNNLPAGQERRDRAKYGRLNYFFPQEWQIIAIVPRAKLNRRKACREALAEPGCVWGVKPGIGRSSILDLESGDMVVLPQPSLMPLTSAQGLLRVHTLQGKAGVADWNCFFFLLKICFYLYVCMPCLCWC